MARRESQGYKKLIVWKVAFRLRRRVYDITKRFPKKEHRRISQMNSAARSVKQNVQEGYFQTTKGFMRYLAISQGSVAELEGDIEDCFDDGLITKEELDELTELCGKLDYLLGRLISSLRDKVNKPKAA